MYVNFTDAALERIETLRDGREGRLHLYYETEGCGCGNSGIFQIRIVTATTPEDGTIESNVGSILVKNWTKVFLDEQMRLDFDDVRRTLILKSDGQVFNRNVLVTDEHGQTLHPVSR